MLYNVPLYRKVFYTNDFKYYQYEFTTFVEQPFQNLVQFWDQENIQKSIKQYAAQSVCHYPANQEVQSREIQTLEIKTSHVHKTQIQKCHPEILSPKLESNSQTPKVTIHNASIYRQSNDEFRHTEMKISEC